MVKLLLAVCAWLMVVRHAVATPFPPTQQGEPVPTPPLVHEDIRNDFKGAVEPARTATNIYEEKENIGRALQADSSGNWKRVKRDLVRIDTPPVVHENIYHDDKGVPVPPATATSAYERNEEVVPAEENASRILIRRKRFNMKRYIETLESRMHKKYHGANLGDDFIEMNRFWLKPAGALFIPPNARKVLHILSTDD